MCSEFHCIQITWIVKNSIGLVLLTFELELQILQMHTKDHIMMKVI